MDAEDPDGWMEGVHGAFCLFGRVEHKNKRSKDVYAIKNASTDFKTVFPETNYLLEMRFFNPASVCSFRVHGKLRVASGVRIQSTLTCGNNIFHRESLTLRGFEAAVRWYIAIQLKGQHMATGSASFQRWAGEELFDEWGLCVGCVTKMVFWGDDKN